MTRIFRVAPNRRTDFTGKQYCLFCMSHCDGVDSTKKREPKRTTKKSDHIVRVLTITAALDVTAVFLCFCFDFSVVLFGDFSHLFLECVCTNLRVSGFSLELFFSDLNNEARQRRECSSKLLTCSQVAVHMRSFVSSSANADFAFE